MSIGPIGGLLNFVGPLPKPPGTASAPEGPTLPRPSVIGAQGATDAMSMIYLALSSSNSSQFRNGESEISNDQAIRRQQEQQEEAALAAEQEAEGKGSRGLFGSITHLAKDIVNDVGTGHFARAVRDTEGDVKAAWNSPRFWHDLEVGARDVAEVAGIAATAAAAVATCGAAAPCAVLVTACALSAAGATESDFHVLEKCGVNAKVASWVGIGLSAGGAVLGGVGALTMSATAVSTFVQAMKTASTTMQVYGGAAQVVTSVAQGRAESFEADVVDDQADAQQADDRAKAVNETTSMVLDGLQDANDSYTRAIQSLQGAMQTNAQTMVVASGRMA